MRDRTDSLAATHSRHACPPPCVSSQVPSSNKSSPQVTCIASRGHTGQQQEYEAKRKPVAKSRGRGGQQQRSALPKGLQLQQMFRTACTQPLRRCVTGQRPVCLACKRIFSTAGSSSAGQQMQAQVLQAQTHLCWQRKHRGPQKQPLRLLTQPCRGRACSGPSQLQQRHSGRACR